MWYPLYCHQLTRLKPWGPPGTRNPSIYVLLRRCYQRRRLQSLTARCTVVIHIYLSTYIYIYIYIYIQSESVNPDIVYQKKSTNQHTACNGFSSIINDSLIRQNRVPRSDTSFRQQKITFQCKMTSIIRQYKNVAIYFHWFSHARHIDML